MKEDTTLVKQTYQYEKSKLGRRTTIENSLNKVNIHYAQSDILANLLITSRSTLKQKINKLFQEKWRIKLTLSPKADTYKLFKNLPKFEKCFDLVANIKHLNALVKLRVSDHQLMIEKGRRYRPPLARHERLCTVCGVLENEAHFLTICPKFHIERIFLYQEVIKIAPTFENIDNMSKFIYLLSQEDVHITRALAKYVFECFKIIENASQS